MSAFVSGMLIFVGSAFLLLALVMGARLAYFVIACVTLAFTLIMALVWSVNPLGPLGKAPEWEPIDAQTDAAALEFDEATEYPDEPWNVPDTDDAIEATQASELESDATNFAQAQVSEGEIEGFPSVPQFRVKEDSTRLLTKEDHLFGTTIIEVLPPIEQPELGIPSDAAAERNAADDEAEAAAVEPLGEIAVVAEYDPGNPLGVARAIAVGTFILLVLHLIGLSLSERRITRERAEATA